jgi:hypothetical protein
MTSKPLRSALRCATSDACLHETQQQLQSYGNLCARNAIELLYQQVRAAQDFSAFNSACKRGKSTVLNVFPAKC